MSLPTRLFKLDAANVHKAFLNPDTFDLKNVPLGEVITTAQLPPSEPKAINYCAVSHVWGQKPPKFTVAKISWPVPISSKEKLFFVLEMSKRRGYEYVWMDVLCIDQGSKPDQTAEMAKMKDYYKNAHATIVFGGDWQNFAPRWHKVQAGIWNWNDDWDKAIDKDWSGLQEIDDLVQDQWFWRVWTLQEAVIPITTRPLDADPAPYSPSRLLTADGDVVDIQGLCELIDWTYVALGKLPREKSKYSWIHPGEGVVNDKGWWMVTTLDEAIQYGGASLHPVQAFMLTLYRNARDSIDKLRGLYGLIDPFWQSQKDDFDEACKEIAGKYIARNEGALLLTMAAAEKNNMTWAAGAFRDNDTQFGTFVPDGGHYTLNSATIINNTTLKLTVVRSCQITVPKKVYGDGSGELAALIGELVGLDKKSFNISSIVDLFQSAIRRARLTSVVKMNDIYDIQKAVNVQGNAISSALRSTFAGWSRRIVIVKKTAFLAWQPSFDEKAAYSLLWVSKESDQWAAIVAGDIKTGCKKVGIAYVGGLLQAGDLPPVSQTEVKIL